MRLKDIIEDLPVKLEQGTLDTNISGLSSNSKNIEKGDLFVAKKGFKYDAKDFSAEAIKNGAVAIVSTSNVLGVDASLASRYYNFPSEKLFTVGITGTNGKTTVSYILKHILDGIGSKCGLIGTIGYITDKQLQKSNMTTPDAITNQKIFAEMVKNGCKSAVMEASSHALDQGRVLGINYDVAVFTNFSQDHLDYHVDMENYFAAKAKLFNSFGVKTSVVNADCPWHKKLRCSGRVLTYGIDNEADVRASDIKMSSSGTTFKIGGVLFETSLIGRFNIYNCLAAISACIESGIEDIAKLLRTFKNVPGRLESVSNERNLNVYVDYAHTEDALENVLKTLEEIKGAGKIITVFGCGGDRDRDKRPKMAAVCEKFSDFCVVTSDNPRSEDPKKICDEIVNGFSKGKFVVELNRREAIKVAVDLATEKDIVLIAGKGHEKVQIFSDNVVEFDDALIAKELARSTTPA